MPEIVRNLFQRAMVIAACAMLLVTAGRQSAPAQQQALGPQVNGVLGSPDATISIKGKQLPSPPMKFGGVIKESYKDSNLIMQLLRDNLTLWTSDMQEAGM